MIQFLVFVCVYWSVFLPIDRTFRRFCQPDCRSNVVGIYPYTKLKEKVPAQKSPADSKNVHIFDLFVDPDLPHLFQ